MAKLEQSPSKAYCLAHGTFSLNLLVSRSRKRKCCTHSAWSESFICMTHFDSLLTDVNQKAHAFSWASRQHIELILAKICWGFKDCNVFIMLENLITCLNSCGFYYEPQPKIKNCQHWTPQEILKILCNLIYECNRLQNRLLWSNQSIASYNI